MAVGAHQREVRCLGFTRTGTGKRNEVVAFNEAFPGFAVPLREVEIANLARQSPRQFFDLILLGTYDFPISFTYQMASEEEFALGSR
ncbi:MAG: hypothetical protein P8L46_13150 [Acidimicrobiales bacterium]|nr:hypothetical protein [Acidimicrobiales bacterium]